MKTKKILAVILVLCLCFSLLSVSASAATYITKSRTIPEGKTFESKWSATYQWTDSLGVPIAVMQYGFNTFLVHEDEVATKGLNNNASQAGLKRGNTTDWGDYVISGYLSEVEKKHISDSVTYYVRIY